MKKITWGREMEEIKVDTIYGTGDFEKDFEDVIELCGTWWNESLFYKLYGIEYSVDKEWFKTIKNYGLIYTCGRQDGKLVSCYVGIKSPYMSNPKVMTSNEIVWCVRKENRSYRELIELMIAIEKLMKENNIELWNLAVSNENIYESTGNFLERKKYKLMDKIYSRREQWQNSQP